MNTYPLDQAGVAAWQLDLYRTSEHAQALERDFIQSDFAGWLTQRFGAEQRQLDYLTTLGEDFVQLLRDELVLSLRAHLLIVFDRQHASGSAGSGSKHATVRSGDSVKVTEIEKWLERRKEGEEEEEEPTDPTANRMNERIRGAESRFVVRTYYPKP